jgi:antitoxin component of MazEF toxin-antitoxin module
MLVLEQIALQDGDIVIIEVSNRGERTARPPLTEAAMTDLADLRLAVCPVADRAADAAPVM